MRTVMKPVMKPVMRTALISILILAGLTLGGCSSGGASNEINESGTQATSTTIVEDAGTGGDAAEADAGPIDITDAIFSSRDADCTEYANDYTSGVVDIRRSIGFDGTVAIGSDSDTCTIVSNNIPNHDFNDLGASFATNVSEVSQQFTFSQQPKLASAPTMLSQRTYDGIMLNGVPIDLLSAGCYAPNSPRADADGNTPIGCTTAADWLLDPLGTAGAFGADEHNAHTQPNGSYHYHGNPNALFDEMPGPEGSPVIGFAADGFPIFGSYLLDETTGQIRKAVSGYSLKIGERPSSAGDPGGTYDGTYIQDWQFTGDGDLDQCNGTTINGQYGYYVTDAYPWIVGCLSGEPHASFDKQGP